MVALLANFAIAQDDIDAGELDENGNFIGRELPKLRSIVFKTSFINPKNKNIEVFFNINYPTNTGNKDLDQYFKKTSGIGIRIHVRFRPYGG
jgi:hypothetical protein